jgi:hypothetical protein
MGLAERIVRAGYTHPVENRTQELLFADWVREQCTAWWQQAESQMPQEKGFCDIGVSTSATQGVRFIVRSAFKVRFNSHWRPTLAEAALLAMEDLRERQACDACGALHRRCKDCLDHEDNPYRDG